MMDGKPGQECTCKDCGAPYVITPEEERHYTRSRPGLRKMTLPVRCPKCRMEHREQVKNLARATIKIPNAETGEGCFLPLTQSYLGKIEGWKSAFDWAKVAPAKYPEQPQAVMFNIDQNLAGLIFFEDLGPKKGLVVKAYDYAPWINDYERGREALFQYMLSESMRRGYGGAFAIEPKSLDRSTAKKLGMEQKSEKPKFYAMPARISQRLVLDDAGVRDETIHKLIERDNAGEADLAWIALKVTQKKLTPTMVDEITKAKSGINWHTLRQYIENRLTVNGRRKDHLARKLQGLFGQLQFVEYLRARDPEVTLRTEMHMMTQSVDIVAAFSRKTTIEECVQFDQVANMIKKSNVVLNKGQGCAVECKTWGMGTYAFPANIETLLQEIRKAKSVLNTVLVVVSSDFDRLEEDRKKMLIERISANGGIVKVMKGFSSDSAWSMVRSFVKEIV